MIERYIQITCDGCGEIEWSPADVGMAEFKAEFIPSWKHRARKSLCPECVRNGVRWKDAKMHDWPTREDKATEARDDNHRV
jgi:hypothetical protein